MITFSIGFVCSFLAVWFFQEFRIRKLVSEAHKLAVIDYLIKHDRQVSGKELRAKVEHSTGYRFSSAISFYTLMARLEDGGIAVRKNVSRKIDGFDVQEVFFRLNKDIKP